MPTTSCPCQIAEFLATADEYNQEPVSKRSLKSGELLCKHKDKDGFEHFAHGLCEKCYNKVNHIYCAHSILTCRLHSVLALCLIVQFTKLSGGLEGGADPPAFQRAEKQRLEAAKRAEEAATVKEAVLEESLCDTLNSDVENTITPAKVIAAVERKANDISFFALGWVGGIGLVLPLRETCPS